MKIITLILSILFLAISCGGGGGGGSSAPIQESSNSSSSSSSSSSSNNSSSSSSTSSSSSDTSSTSAITSTANTSSNYFDVSSAQNDVLVIGGEAINVIGGKAVDGYIDGAKVFIDENFNLKFDEGEIWGVTNASGSFLMNGTVQRLLSMNLIEQKTSGTNPTYDYKTDGTTSTATQVEVFYNCLRKRPLVAQVPKGAVDSTQGVVEQEYEMILPAIDGFFSEISGEGGSDPDYSSIIISPFSNFLSSAVIAGIENVNLKKDLTLSEGCSSKGTLVEQSVRGSVNAALSRIQNNFGIDYREFLRDFVAQSTNNVITEDNATLIASWLPLLTALKYEIGKQIKDEIGDDVVPIISIEEEVSDKFLSNADVDEIDLDFYFRYTSEPNSDGWFYEQSIQSDGAKLVKTQAEGTTPAGGKIKPFKCANGADDCLISSLTLDGVFDAAEKQTELMYFIKNGTISGYENINLSIFDERQGRWDGDDKDSRSCVFSQQIHLQPDNGVEGYTTNFRNTNSRDYYDVTDLDCSQKGKTGEKNFYMFWVIQDDNNTDTGRYEEYEFRLMTPLVSDAVHLENKIQNPYDNRDQLESLVPAYLDELTAIPFKFSQYQEIKNYLLSKNPNQKATFYLQNRDSDIGGRAYKNVPYFLMNPSDTSQDEYYEITTDFEQVNKLTGQAARDAFFNALKASISFSSSVWAGESAPTG